MQFSGEQEQIFNWFRRRSSGNLVVKARAGSGKTTTIKEAFPFAPENRMLYAVFNKKNQLEAAAKIKDTRVAVKTLSAVGYGLVCKQWGRIMADDFVERDRVKRIAPSCPEEVITQVCKLAAFLKNLFICPSLQDARETADERGIDCVDFNWDDKVPQLALDVLELSKKNAFQGRISFNDMVWLPVANNWASPSFDLVTVDECQDMNICQLEMSIRLSAGRICLVGDDKQAIYGFRGAASDGIALYTEKLKAEVLGLSTTYRCPKKVVALAQRFVPEFKAHDGNIDGEIHALPEEQMLDKVKVGDAVLSRVNAPLMRNCLALLRKGISAKIEGRDIGKTLENIVKGLKAKSIEDFCAKLDSWKIKQAAKAVGRYADKKLQLIQDQGDMLEELVDVCSSVEEILSKLTNLFQDSINGTPKPCVIFSTVHKAKGLEWPNVFILKDTFAAIRKHPCANIQEEDNIEYVAITRSQSTLTLVSAFAP
jgi:hypothetical protein